MCAQQHQRRARTQSLLRWRRTRCRFRQGLGKGHRIPRCQQGTYPSRLDQLHQHCAHKVSSKERHSVPFHDRKSEGYQLCDCKSSWHMRYQYRSYRWGNQESRRSSQHYGSYRGTWGTRGRPTSRIQRTRELDQLLCRKHRACSSRLHRRGIQHHEGSSTSKRVLLRRSPSCSEGSKGRHPSLCHQDRWKEAHQRCDHRPSSSTSETHRCDGNRDGSGE